MPLKDEQVYFDCLVCSKSFRGGSDLRRHQWGVSIQHLTSCEKSSLYPHQCKGCGFYFKSKDHLKLHESCKLNRCQEIPRRPISPNSRKLYHHAEDDIQDGDPMPVSARGSDESDASSDITPNQKRKPSDMDSMSGSPDKISAGKQDTVNECMVCGKMFYHGPIDIERHKVSATLRHLYSKTKSLLYKYPCDRCGLYFAQQEHVTRHQTLSSCNTELIRSKPQQVIEDIIPAEDSPLKSDRSTRSVGKQKYQTNSSTEVDDSVPSWKRRAIFVRPSSIPPPLFDSWQINRPKRTRMLVPKDRKAFFSLVSLLVDPALVPAGLQLNSENYEQYIPESKRASIEKLRQILNYDC